MAGIRHELLGEFDSEAEYVAFLESYPRPSLLQRLSLYVWPTVSVIKMREAARERKRLPITLERWKTGVDWSAPFPPRWTVELPVGFWIPMPVINLSGDGKLFCLHYCSAPEDVRFRLFDQSDGVPLCELERRRREPNQPGLFIGKLPDGRETHSICLQAFSATGGAVVVDGISFGQGER